MRWSTHDAASSFLGRGKRHWGVTVTGLALLAAAACASRGDAGGKGPASGAAASTWVQSSVDQASIEAGEGDGGSPTAVVSTGSIAFGLTNCGSSASQTATVQNTGTGTLVITASTTGAWFSVTPTSATIAPGASAVLTVAVTVPPTAAAAVAHTGKVHITTNESAHAHDVIALSATSQGVTLVYPSTPHEVDFGATPAGTTVPAALVLQNTGNATAAIALGTPSDAAFSLNTSNPANQLSAAPGNDVTQSLDFAPTANGVERATMSVTITNGAAVCGTSVSVVKMSGAGSSGALAGWPTSYDLAGLGVDFGPVSCGSTAPTQSFTLSNDGAAAVTITAVTLTGTSGYSTGLAAGTVIAAGGSLLVDVNPAPVPFPSSPSATYPGTLTVTTSVHGDAPHVLTLAQSAYGAVLSLVASDLFGTFGSVPDGVTASEPFQIVNDGTSANISVNVAGDPSFGVVTSTFASGSGLQTSQTFSDTATFSPTTVGSFGGTLTVTADALCQSAPSVVTLGGNGESSADDAGSAEDAGTGGEDAGPSLTASPGFLSFRADCPQSPKVGTTPIGGPKLITITNTSGASLAFTASVGTSDFLVGPTAGTLGAGASTTIGVLAGNLDYPLPPSVSDVLDIQTGDQIIAVPISESFEGIYLPTTSIDFGDVPVGTEASQTIDVVSTQEIVQELGASSAMPDPPFGLEIAGVQYPSSPTQPWIVSFLPTSTGLQTGTATFLGGAMAYYCTPNTIALSGTGD
jgi:hypothetical protein